MKYEPNIEKRLNDTIYNFIAKGPKFPEKLDTLKVAHMAYSTIEVPDRYKPYDLRLQRHLYSEEDQIPYLYNSLGVVVEDVELNRNIHLQSNGATGEALVNEISSAIERHVLSRLFANGWKSAYDFYKANNTTCNVCFDKQYCDFPKPTFPCNIGKQLPDGTYNKADIEGLTIPFKHFHDENLTTDNIREDICNYFFLRLI